MNGAKRVSVGVIFLLLLAGCVGNERASDAEVETEIDVATDSIEGDEASEPPAEAEEGDALTLSVEIPVDDVSIVDGAHVAVDELLDTRTGFTAADFHLREVVMIARSKDDASVRLVVDQWASDEIGIPQGVDDFWYEVRIPATTDDSEPGVAWLVDFTGSVDLNLLVAILEPRTGVVPVAAATVRKVALSEPVPDGDADSTAAAPPGGPVVASHEAVEGTGGEPIVTPTVVEIVERPVYRTIYREVERPRVVSTYHVSWIHDPAHHYVFHRHNRWSYRYFAGSWDWRCYDLNFRHPRHHHHRNRSHDGHRHRSHRDDRHRSDRRHRGDRDRRDGRRDRRDDRRRDGERRHHQDTERTVVERPQPERHPGSTRLRRLDEVHLRQRVASRRNAEPRDRDDLRASRVNGVTKDAVPKNPRLRAIQKRELRIPSEMLDDVERRRISQRPNPFRRQIQSGGTPQPKVAATESPRRIRDASATRPTTPSKARERVLGTTQRAATRPETPRNVRQQAFHRELERRPAVAPPRQTAEPRRVEPRSPSVRARVQSRVPEIPRNVRQRAFHREQERRPAVTPPRQTAEPRRVEPRSPSVRARVQSRVPETPRNVRQRAFHREQERRPAVAPPRQTAEPRRVEPRSSSARSRTQSRTAEIPRNARQRVIQREAQPRVSAPSRATPRHTPTSQHRPRVQARPRSAEPARPAPSRQATPKPPQSKPRTSAVQRSPEPAAKTPPPERPRARDGGRRGLGRERR